MAVPERNALVLLDKAYGCIPTIAPPVSEGANHTDLPELMGCGECGRVVKASIAGDSM